MKVTMTIILRKPVYIRPLRSNQVTTLPSRKLKVLRSLKTAGGGGCTQANSDVVNGVIDYCTTGVNGKVNIACEEALLF